jgi:hypothetical protein
VDNVTTLPATLLIHDGELADVRDLLIELDVEFGEHRGQPSLEEMQAASDLVITTANRMVDLAVETLPRKAVRIAVLGSDSRTLRTMLRRAGINLLVRRPVHPTALRLLILHSLYRGPEKRRTDRVLVGFPVRYRAGLRRRPAMLVDLSLTGCRLITERRLDKGKRIAVQLPSDVAGRRPLTVMGNVVRVRDADDHSHGRFDLAISFDVSADVEPRLRTAVLTHAAGPAMLHEHPSLEPPSPVPAIADAPPLPANDSAASEAPAAAETDDAPTPPGTGSQTEAPPAEAVRNRRAGPRRPLKRHFVAMTEEATRVLIGRDISLGGMRIDPHPTLSISDELSIAVHLRALEAPMLIQARVERDDGDRGMLLQFHDLPEETAKRLDRIVDILPILAVDEAAEADEAVVVSEILELEAP